MGNHIPNQDILLLHVAVVLGVVIPITMTYDRNTHFILVQLALVLDAQQAVGADENASGPICVIHTVQGCRSSSGTRSGLKREGGLHKNVPFDLLPSRGIIKLTAVTTFPVLLVVRGALVAKPSSWRQVDKVTQSTTERRKLAKAEGRMGKIQLTTHQSR